MKGSNIVLVLLVIVIVIWFIKSGFDCGCKEGYSETDEGLCGCSSQYGMFLSQCSKPSVYTLGSSLDECADFGAPYNSLGADVRAVPSKYDKDWFVPSTKYGHSPGDRQVRAQTLGEYATTPNAHGITPCQRYCKIFYDGCMKSINDPLRCKTETENTCLPACSSSMNATPMQAIEEGNQITNHPQTFCSQTSLSGCPSGNQECIQTLQSSCAEIFDL